MSDVQKTKYMILRRRRNERQVNQRAIIKDGKLDYEDDEIEFMKAMDAYKRDNHRPFPTWCEVLEVLIRLGYHKGDKVTG